MLYKRILGSTLIATIAITAPVFAQSQIDNNQPVQGSLHTREVEIQNKLNASYKAGFISSTELAELQRDLDGILVKEERQRTKAGGLTGSNFDSISKALDCFEGKITTHARRVASTSDSSSVVVPVGTPVVPITGNQSSIIQPAKPTLMVPATTIVPSATTTIVPSATTTIVPSSTSVTRIESVPETTTRTTTVRQEYIAP